ncbi:N-acetylglucosaminidase [Serratia sp. DD3]|uniref:N-acetylglucosaminidase n=1 Tax=Serratia sp. DD3 TaxID=1410619 RepID=UPI00190FBE89|nr:N-acetylglucosaminidase [Serratia sp. DD3]
MFNKDTAIVTLHAGAVEVIGINARRIRNGEHIQLNYGMAKCARYVKRALISGGLSPNGSSIESAKDYGTWLVENNFNPVDNATTVQVGNVYSISGQQAGDVVVIQAVTGHRHGHIAMFDGTKWVSDYVQDNGFYPAQAYRTNNTAYVLYRHSDAQPTESTPPPESNKGKIKICYPIPKQSGQEFNQLEEILSHLEGESTGLYMIGRNGMWHGGIHITNATTPWCALSGREPSEHNDFSVPYKGEQYIRCMADGEVVAYRICSNYMTLDWTNGPLNFSGSFLLVRHYIQPGEKEESGLHFYTLYMHLAPYSVYEQVTEEWITTDLLKGYSEADWVSQGNEKPVRYGRVKKDIHVTWNSLDSSLVATKNGRTYGLVTLKQDTSNLKAGERVWMLVDKGNIKQVSGGKPSWWSPMLPPNPEKIQFNQVVSVSKPYAIKAGDSVGHLGYFQAPKEGWHEARYQVHIECFSMDENLPKFLANPDKVGQDKPLYLKYSPGLALYQKDAQTGRFTASGKVTEGEAILQLSNVPLEPKNAQAGQAQYYQIKEGYVLKGETSPERLSQYDLEKLGFEIIKDEPESFDHLDGETPPGLMVKTVLKMLRDLAKKDTRPRYSLVAHNYQRLLDKIDLNHDGKYSPEEYRSAIHIPDYRDQLYKIIVNHPSDWYHKKEDNIWLKYFNKLTKDAPEWKGYGEDFIDKMAWMQDLKTEKLGPSLWHMHPLMFLGALMQKQKYIIKYTHYSSTVNSSLDKQMALGRPNSRYGPQIGTASGRFVPVGRDIVSTYITPKPFEETVNSDMFQYMILNSYIGISKEAIATALKGKGILAGKEDCFIEAAKTYNVNEMYLVAHAIVETNHGRSTLATGSLFNGRLYYNMYGVGAVDGVAVPEGTRFAAQQNWDTPERAIIGGAQFASREYFLRGQDTLYKMRWNPDSPATHQYATAVNWAETQSGIIYKMAIKSPDSVIYFDFPIYAEEA